MLGTPGLRSRVQAALPADSLDDLRPDAVHPDVLDSDALPRAGAGVRPPTGSGSAR